MIKCMLCEEGTIADLDRTDMFAEWKYDGTRVLIIKEAGKIKLQNREGSDYTVRLPEIVEAAKKLDASQFILDGEAVFINPSNKIEFVGSQVRCATQYPDFFVKQQYPIIHKCFDILELNGINFTADFYENRKLLLWDLLKGTQDTIQYVDYARDAKRLFKEIYAQGEEGLILKRSGSRYEHTRSYNWLKVKNWMDDVCRVVGYTPGKNSRSTTFGALVLSKDGIYRGCVGSGFNDWQLKQIKDELDQCLRTSKPFTIDQDYIAVKTALDVKVKYYKITDNGVMRFPVFEGIVS